MRPDALVLGGGAAGLLAAAAFSGSGARVALLERGPRVGRKLLATGNGRCNLSNRDMRPALYGEAAPFVSRVFAAAPPERVLSFLGALGLMLREEEGRLYPRTMQAASALDVLRDACARGGVEILTDYDIASLAPVQGGIEAHARDGRTLRAPFALAALGGSAAPHLGTDGSGAHLMRALGHTTAPEYPALVQLVCRHPALRALKGIRAPAALTLLVDRCEAAREEGELLFADYGVSGVAVFQLSRFAAPALAAGRDVRLMIDLLPEAADGGAWLASRIASLPSERCAALFAGALPRLLAQSVLREARVNPDTPAASLGSEARARIVSALKAFPLRVEGTKGFGSAQVTRGGVSLCEVDPDTLASRVVPGLYLAGELLDVDGPCGGYNLHFAFASALAAADAIRDRLGLPGE